MSERVNARLKDEFGAGHIRVCGPEKVMVLAVDQGWETKPIKPASPQTAV